MELLAGQHVLHVPQAWRPCLAIRRAAPVVFASFNGAESVDGGSDPCFMYDCRLHKAEIDD